jgi:hypothetical protein
MQGFPLDPLISLSTLQNHYSLLERLSKQWYDGDSGKHQGGELLRVRHRIQIWRWIGGLAGEQVTEPTLLLRYTGYECSWFKLSYPAP